ncbi:ketopantoate reductase family protein [Chloroflexota bacterium]
MKVIIYGAGAIGSVVGGHLFRAGSQVVLVGRPGHVTAIRDHGLRLITPVGTYIVRVPAVTAPDEIDFAPDDVVFLCVKSQDADEALQSLKSVAAADVPIFCFQNGVRNEHTALQYFPRVYGVRVRIHSAFLVAGEAITRRDPPGWLVIGRYPTGTDSLAESVATDLRRAGFDVLVTPEIMPFKWGKLLRNLSNAIGAITNEREDNEARLRLVKATQQEAQEILARAGIRWISDEEELQLWPERMPVRSSQKMEAQSSTWQSLARGRGTVETDFLNGEIVQLARQLGRQAPINEALLRLTKEMAEKHEMPGKHASTDLLRLLGLD